MHVARIPSRYVSKSGEERRYESVLLRRTFRQDGKVRHETLANLSQLPGEVITLVDAALKGAILVDAGAVFETERSVPHGDVAAVHVMASKLGLAKLLGPACAERDTAYALILSRAVRPESKLSTAGWWASGDTTLGADLGVAGSALMRCTRRWTGWFPASGRSRPSWRGGTFPPAGSRCPACPPRGWRARAAGWRRSGIRGTAGVAAGRSSTGC